MLMIDENTNLGSNYPINIITVGSEAERSLELLPADYWKNTQDTGYIGVNLTKSGSMDGGIDILPHGGASLNIARQVNDVISAQNAVAPYVQTVNELLENTRLNLVLSFLGDAFPSGVSPAIAAASTNQGAITVAVMALPRKSEGRKHHLYAQYTQNELKSAVDAKCFIPLDILCDYLAPHVMVTMLEESVQQVFSRAVRGIVDLASCPGFRSPSKDEIEDFFRFAGKILFSYTPLNGSLENNVTSIRKALKNPIDLSRRFEDAEEVLVSVCLGNGKIDMDLFLNLDNICQEVLGRDINILVGNFKSKVHHEEPWISFYGRGIRDKANDGFDFVEHRKESESTAPALPAYYRKFFGRMNGRYH